MEELTARSRAFDINSQFGWEQVTHDESMNYYFVKDKAGDETDEFYDSAELRRERAERYRKLFTYEQPRSFLLEMLILSVIFIVSFLMLGDDTSAQCGLMWFYIIFTVINITALYSNMVWGQRIYTEFCMSREEWERHKKYSDKKRFRKVRQLRSYLAEKSDSGLSLKGYENRHYILEEDTRRYDYFIDTRNCLKKRLKEDGLHFTEEKKDWQAQSLKWYEMSIANAEQYGLKPVAVISKSALIYKRPHSDEPLPQENGNANINSNTLSRGVAILAICGGIIGFIIGFVVGFTSV